jgi:hypothetical protein
MIELWLRAFLWTLALELPIVYAIFRHKKVSSLAIVGIFLLANGMTHPALWFVMPRFSPYWLWILVAESLVTVGEAILYRRLHVSWRLALFVSILANAFSTLVGLTLL